MIASLLGFALALAESGLGLGVLVPGELAISALAAGADGLAERLGLVGAVALGATTGDHLGYLVGRRGGTRLRTSRLVVARVGLHRWDHAEQLVQKLGFWGVLISRLLPVVHTILPVVAGAAALRYRAFLAASVIGAVTWSALWVGAGSGVAVSGVLGHPAAIVTTVVVGVIGAIIVRRAARRRRCDGCTRGDDPADKPRRVAEIHGLTGDGTHHRPGLATMRVEQKDITPSTHLHRAEVRSRESDHDSVLEDASKRSSACTRTRSASGSSAR